MKKRTTIKRAIKLSAFLSMLSIIGVALLINACNKSSNIKKATTADDELRAAARVPLVQHEPVTSTVTIANIRTSADGDTTRVMFNENEQIFTVQDATTIATLKTAFTNNQAVQITFDPWAASVSLANVAPSQDQAYFATKEKVNSTGITLKIGQFTTDDIIDHTADMGVINLNTDTLNNVIPDFATAQLMFDYIAHQCCVLPGPYAVDHCITFQYCEDGCYARAHKMCFMINSMYHYGTQKVFSFANDAAGVDELCVKAEKWGGCCINWWYHVAPLVTINTTKGPKAYVFDPAMFDQPVLLSTWLHAQENPACDVVSSRTYTPHVTMINIQPTASYSPSNSTGYSFDTDPHYTNTNSTMVSYRYLTSCP